MKVSSIFPALDSNLPVQSYYLVSSNADNWASSTKGSGGAARKSLGVPEFAVEPGYS